MKNFLIALISLIVIFSCQSEKKATKAETKVAKVNSDFDQVLEDYYQEGLKLNPLIATSQGDNRYNDYMPDFLSKDYQDQLKNYYVNYKNKANAFEDSALSDTQRMSKDILIWECDINLEGMEFDSDLTPINQMWTLQLNIGQLASGASAQPFKTVEDYEMWLSRLDGYLDWLNSAEKKMKEGIDNNYVLPKSLIAKVLPQLKAMTVTNLDEHLFFAPVRNFPDSFSTEDKQRLKESYEAKIENEIIPAYTKLYNFMKDEYLPSGRDSDGFAALPNGEALYNHQIKLYTTTDMTADQIHQLGLDEVERILTEMEKVKNEVGFEGDIISFFDHVRENKELMPFSKPQEIIENFNAIHETMTPQINKLFDLKPKTDFEVRRTEAFREKSASAEYNPGSLDGTRPGIFYVPIPDADSYNIYSDESLFLHEAIPGHHYQISLQQENEKLPKFRKSLWYSAYGEGWALYSESLGKELGLFTDPYQYFGMLSAEMHRAIRLVVDTGLHSKGWSREKAIQYSLDNEAESEASITSEIERYMANGGQALSYKIGQLKIRELRAKAENELGNNFKIAQFHNEVLRSGCVPLAILEDNINSWINESKQ